MPFVLVIDSDPTFSAVLEDHMRVAGHRTRSEREAMAGLAAATETPADLVVVDRDLPLISGLEIVRRLRSQAETRAVPIIVLSAREDRADRLTVLRAGADDILDRSVDFEELELRANRLLGHRPAAVPVLDGDLESHPLNELLQFVRHADKTGRLTLRTAKGSGEAWLDEGHLAAARWQRLRGREAMIAMLEIRKGRFRFETLPLPEGLEADHYPLHGLIFHAAWIEDELTMRRAHVPPTGAALEAHGGDIVPPRELGSLPITPVHEHIRAFPGSRIYDLIERIDEPPGHLRLAAAWLIEQGAVAIVEPTAVSPSTSEISGTLLLQVTLAQVLSSARHAGFDTRALPFLVAVDRASWPSLRQAIQGAPGYLRSTELQNLVSQVEETRAGSVLFETDVGKLSLHVQVLDADRRAPIETIVPLCATVLLWLAETPLPPGVRETIERLEAHREPAGGLAVATGSDVEAALQPLLREGGKWRSSRRAPKSLVGVLRLLEPSR